MNLLNRLKSAYKDYERMKLPKDPCQTKESRQQKDYELDLKRTTQYNKMAYTARRTIRQWIKDQKYSVYKKSKKLMRTDFL